MIWLRRLLRRRARARATGPAPAGTAAVVVDALAARRAARQSRPMPTVTAEDALRLRALLRLAFHQNRNQKP